MPGVIRCVSYMLSAPRCGVVLVFTAGGLLNKLLDDVARPLTAAPGAPGCLRPEPGESDAVRDREDLQRAATGVCTNRCPGGGCRHGRCGR